MLEDYDIVGSFNKQRFENIDSERSINLFEYIDPKGKKPKTLISTSGIIDSGISFSRATLGFRASFIFNDVSYHVIGNSVYSVNASNAPAFLGNINTEVGYVGIEANTFQVIFVDGKNGYIWDTIALNNLIQITDTSFPAKPIDVTYLDGFFVVANGDTNTFQLSSFNQGLIWGPSSNQFTTNIGTLPDQLIVGISNFTNGVSGTPNYQTGVSVTLTLGAGGSLAGTGLAVSTTYYCIYIDATHIKLATSYTDAINGNAINITSDVTSIVNIVSTGQLQLGAINSHPGTIVGCRTLHRRLFLFSQNFTEVWENQGQGTNLPFRRNNSMLMEYGCASLPSIRTGFDRMFFLSQDKDGLGAVMEVLGSESMPVSTRAIDFEFAQYAGDPHVGVSDATGILIKENGIIFYRLNFTKANKTWVLNVSMSTREDPKWHEEELLNGDRHPAQTHVYFNGINYYGSYISPILYIVDNSITTNGTEAIKRVRIGRPIVTEGYNRRRIDRFQLDLRQGFVSDIVISEGEDLITEDGNELVTESNDNITTQSGVTTVINDEQPIVFLSYSRDGGNSFGNRLTATMGKLGQRSYRTVWRKLGTVPRGQAFIPKIEFFNELPFIVLGAAWSYEILPE